MNNKQWTVALGAAVLTGLLGVQSAAAATGWTAKDEQAREAQLEQQAEQETQKRISAQLFGDRILSGAELQQAQTAKEVLVNRKLDGTRAASAEFDPAKNPRVLEISKELRCLVCQNESIAESNADLAVDLRREVVRLVKEGKTNREVIDYMVDRYGDYVLFKPIFKANTYLLWLGPLVFFLLAFGALIRMGLSRRARVRGQSAQIDPAQLDKAKAILQGRLVFKNGEFVANPTYTQGDAPCGKASL